jgi:hypothetical protein
MALVHSQHEDLVAFADDWLAGALSYRRAGGTGTGTVSSGSLEDSVSATP